jgi:DNA-directed RNA polymerase subunit F
MNNVEKLNAIHSSMQEHMNGNWNDIMDSFQLLEEVREDLMKENETYTLELNENQMAALITHNVVDLQPDEKTGVVDILDKYSDHVEAKSTTSDELRLVIPYLRSMEERGDDEAKALLQMIEK